MAIARKKFQTPAPTDVQRVLHTLSSAYGSAKTELAYENPFQLLVAVILSAQCTDVRVNRTTPALFARYPTAERLAAADPKDVEKLIHSCGFFRQKTKSIISVARDLLEKFDGKVPNTLDELTTLRGVGRKTASVVLNQAFDLPAIAVDTHVMRVSQRLGWTHNKTPEKIEFDLRDLVPMPQWALINGLLVLHGRRTCQARKPNCPNCGVREVCVYFKSTKA